MVTAKSYARIPGANDHILEDSEAARYRGRSCEKRWEMSLRYSLGNGCRSGRRTAVDWSLK